MSKRIRARVQVREDGQPIDGELYVGWPPGQAVFGEWHVLRHTGWVSKVDPMTGVSTTKETFRLIYTIPTDEIDRLKRWLPVHFLVQAGDYAVFAHAGSMRSEFEFVVKVTKADAVTSTKTSSLRDKGKVAV